MMTAAGTIPAAKVLVVGAGVAGLQAIATAKRMGAIVFATDVRTASKEQVESLGGKFLTVEGSENLETEGGYAKEASEDFKKKQEELLGETLKKIDIVICTALIPGKKAPLIIKESMINNMQPGSVIYDLAAVQGGNTAFTEVDKIVDKNGVRIMGETNILNKLPVSASSLYAKNMFNDVRAGMRLDVVREGMNRRRGIQEPVMVEKQEQINAKEFSWQGYDTLSLSTCDEAYEMYDEIVNSISQSSFTKPELAYLKESLILVDKCLTIAQVPEETIKEQDVRDYMECSGKAIRLLEGVGKRTGIPFNYSFLNDLQVRVVEDIKPIKTFTQFSGEMYGIR